MLARMARNELGMAIERYLGERSQTSLAKQAKTTQPTISRIIRGVHVPAPDTIEAIAKVLELDPLYLLRLAGLPIPAGGNRDPSVEYLADRLNALPDEIRPDAIDALGAQLDAIYRIAGLKPAAKVVETITEGYEVMSEQERLAELIRQFRDADPEGYEEFVAALFEDDEKKSDEPDTSDDEGRETQ